MVVIVPIFVLISVIGLLAALGTVLSRNLVHAALYLVAFFFTIACQFVLLEAEFLAAIQVLVYIGAVAIILMFGIMLTRNILGDDTTSVPAGWKLPAGLASLTLFGVLAYGISNHKGTHGSAATVGTAWSSVSQRPGIGPDADPKTPRAVAIANMGKTVGDEMMTRYVVGFEVAGLLLTAAIVGAVVLAYRDGADDDPARRVLKAVGLFPPTPPPPGRAPTPAAGPAATAGEQRV
ncbi:MAG: NADH-quinone oxidoreductase subunit J [Planctomycetota bacterium]|nr:NADH-quinone oxidoreductase subunit J [Planctomycetota bacterium]